MKIESKFNVGDIVKFKYQTSSNENMTVLEAHQVSTETCIGGTQIFYYCRLIALYKQYKEKYKSEGEYKWVSGIAWSNDLSSKLQRLGEHELIKLTKEELQEYGLNKK